MDFETLFKLVKKSSWDNDKLRIIETVGVEHLDQEKYLKLIHLFSWDDSKVAFCKFVLNKIDMTEQILIETLKQLSWDKAKFEVTEMFRPRLKGLTGKGLVKSVKQISWKRDEMTDLLLPLVESLDFVVIKKLAKDYKGEKLKANVEILSGKELIELEEVNHDFAMSVVDKVKNIKGEELTKSDMSNETIGEIAKTLGIEVDVENRKEKKAILKINGNVIEMSGDQVIQVDGMRITSGKGKGIQIKFKE